MKKFNLITLATLLITLLFVPRVHADTFSVDFENPPYAVGSINGQDGWSSTGGYDQGVVASPVISGAQSFRISNSVTSGSFGDQTFAKPLVNSVGEAGSTDGTFSAGAKQTHFETQFDIQSSTPATQQPDLFISVSPDRGDGSRMSYLGFEDTASGINVIFYDVQGSTPGPANFVLADLGTYSRAEPHTIKLTLDVVDGPSNDVVKVWIDGVLKKTGTSWENYYRFDPEANAEQSPRIVKTVLFRAGGTAVPANDDKGFLIDNLILTSGPTPVSTVKVTIDKYIGNSMATAITANSSAFPMTATWNATNIGAGSGSYVLGTVGHNSPTAYEAVTSDMTAGADYTTSEVTGGAVVGADCTAGKPYALDGYTSGDTLAAAQAATKSSTAPNFTNLQSDKFVIVWNKVCEAPTPTLSPTPTPIPNLPVACAGMNITNIITGTNRSEVLNGTSGSDFINGVGGSDVINGADGNDCILAGNGSSVLNGGAGSDVIVAGNASDTVNGGTGNDKIWGNNGSDYLAGGAGSDEIHGGNGSDVLSGEADNDMLFGDLGSDLTLGGTGSDTCVGEVKTSCEL